MRLFWTFIAVLLIGGVAAAWLQFAADAETTPLAVPDRGSTAASSTASAPEAGDASAIAPPIDDTDTDATDSERDDALALADELRSDAEQRLDAPPQDAPAFDTGDAPGLPLGLDAEIPSATVEAGRVVESGDALIADDRFEIPGSGTEDDPYVVDWKLLVSASESYQPRLGDLRLPQRIALLNGAWVRIEGFAAFPLVATDPREMLLMLNQWDGCCIGIPPTPYDAIEVRLTAPPRNRQQRMAYYGSVTGRLSVEPYLIDSWLVGLYLMDDALFEMDL